jgi:hypothetical protein
MDSDGVFGTSGGEPLIDIDLQLPDDAKVDEDGGKHASPVLPSSHRITPHTSFFLPSLLRPLSRNVGCTSI